MSTSSFLSKVVTMHKGCVCKLLPDGSLESLMMDFQRVDFWVAFTFLPIRNCGSSFQPAFILTRVISCTACLEKVMTSHRT